MTAAAFIPYDMRTSMVRGRSITRYVLVEKSPPVPKPSSREKPGSLRHIEASKVLDELNKVWET